MVAPDRGPRKLWHYVEPLAFALGAAGGGTATSLIVFALLAAVPPVPFGWRLPLFAAILVVSMAVDLGRVPVPLPGARRQVPSSVLRWGLSGTAIFGFEMGSGVRTYNTSAMPLSMVILLLTFRPAMSTFLACGFLFGLARGLVPVSRLLARHRKDWGNRMLLAADRGIFPRSTSPALIVGFTLLFGN